MNTDPHMLVTGADGFIGRPLCRFLLDEGCRASGTVRHLKPGSKPPVGLQLHETGDLESFNGWPALLRGVDAVVHLAARVHVMGETNAAALEKYREANVVLTERLIRAAAAAAVRRFVFVSSVKVLGEGGAEPYTEESAPAPGDPYGISKLEAEQAVQAAGRETGIETVILRLPLVYGPGVRANFLRLMKLVKTGLPLPLGAVHNQRSMVFIGNLVDALRVCLQHENAAGETFMVSDGNDFSTPGLIREIAAAMEKKARLVPFPPALLRLAGGLTGKGPEVDRLLGSLSVDCGKIRDRLNWVPPFTAAEGIEKSVAWYLESAR